MPINQTEAENRARIRNDVLIAEGLRLDKKYRQAIELFENIEKDDKFDLLPREMRWVLAHHGAAAQESYVPYSDREGDLDGAEELLRRALAGGGVDLPPDLPPDPLSDPPPDDTLLFREPLTFYPCAWARLGEVYRLKGSLPSLDFEWIRVTGGHQLRLLTRGRDDDYKLSRRCFVIASRQRRDYPWANAHHAALLLNQRRFQIDLVKKKEETKCARNLLDAALEKHQHRNVWALFQAGSAHFVTFVDSFIESMKDKCPPTERHANERESMVLAAYSFVIGMKDDSSSVYRHPVHPGTIARDEYLTMTYDFFEYMPALIKDRALRELGDLFWKAVYLTLDAGYHFLREDPVLPGSDGYRYSYAFFFAEFQERQYLAALTSSGHADSGARSRLESVDEISEGLKLRARLQRKAQEDLIQGARDLLAAAALPSGRRPDVFTSPHRKREAARAGTGVLLRVFDVMMILLKRGVIAHIEERDDELELRNVIIAVLDHFNHVLPVLKGPPGGAAMRAIATVKNLVNERKPGEWWLLAPQWALDQRKRELVKEFLRIDEPLDFGKGA